MRRSMFAVALSACLATTFLIAQIVFQTSIAALRDIPDKWMSVFGLIRFDSASVGSREIVPEVLVILTAFVSRRELLRELDMIREGTQIQSTWLARLASRALQSLFGITEEELVTSSQKWWRLLGFLCCGMSGFSANGVLQFFLFLSVHSRLAGGHGDARTSTWTRLRHKMSSTNVVRVLSSVILLGSYLFTSFSNAFTKLEVSKVPALLGFWWLGNDGKLCCMRPSEATGFAFLFVAHFSFAMALANGDTGKSFTFRELMGFEIRRSMYRPLLYLPIVGLAITLTALTNTSTSSSSIVETVDLFTVLSTTIWMLASARSSRSLQEVRRHTFEEKWLARVRDILTLYITFQYAYIALLYVYNVPEVSTAVAKAWPSSLQKHLTPADFGLFQVSALDSWRLMYPRYFTLVLCLGLHYWTTERMVSDARDPSSDEESDDDFGTPTPLAQRLEVNVVERKVGPYEMRPSLFLYEAFATIGRHIRLSVGEQFESTLYGISMEALLIVATICIAFRIEILSLAYAVVILFACLELAVPTIKGKRAIPLRYGAFRLLGTSIRIMSDVWRLLRYHFKRRNEISAADVQNTPPLGSRISSRNRANLREADFDHDAPISLHTEVNDYGFFLLILATISIMIKQLTLLTIFQTGALSTLVNKNWGSWLGLISLTDTRLGSAMNAELACCAWPYVIDSSKTFCYDPDVVSSSSNRFSTRACLDLETNWYTFGMHFAVVILAGIHALLQRRNNAKMQMKAKSMTARATPRASYWAKLRGEVAGCDVAAKLKLLVQAERMKRNPSSTPTPSMKKKKSGDEIGASPMIQQTPIQADEDIFASFPIDFAKKGNTKLQASKMFGWRALVTRMVYRFVTWDLKSTFERLDKAIEQMASVKYLLAMAVLLVNAFLKSDVTSSVYIIILGYFLAFNNREGVVRFQSQGYAIMLVIGTFFTIHIVTALRLPSSVLSADYCETCPEKRFWLDIWGCPSNTIYAPPPPSPPSPPAGISTSITSCSDRPVIVSAYEIISDILVIILISHYVRKGHKNMVRDDVRTAWMRGYMRYKGQQNGNEWVNSEAFTALADRVNARLAERRKLDETSELSFNDKIKRWDAVAAQLKGYLPDALRDNQREETKRAQLTSKRLQRQVSLDRETAIVTEKYSFGQIVKLASDMRDVLRQREAEEAMGHTFLKFCYKYLLMLIIVLTMVSAVTQADSDFVSLGYAGFAIAFALRYDHLRVNARIFPNRAHKWWNGEMFRLLQTYIFIVLTAKLVYQIPYIKPILLSGRKALDGVCVEGTSKCETINSLFGIRKLGSACDSSMLESDCVPVLSWKGGSIGLDVVLFMLCSIQGQLFSNERYVRAVLKFEKQFMDRSARRAILYRRYLLGWRAKTQNETDAEYADIVDKVGKSATQAREWTRFQKYRQSMDQENVIDTYVPKNIHARAESATTVLVTWSMNPSATDVEEFTVKRERSPRTTILPHHINPIKVRVDPESRLECKCLVDGLTPGVSYSFTVQSCTSSVGYGPPSEPSNVVKLPEDSETQTLENKLGFKDKVINGFAALFSLISNYAAYLLDPALYPLADTSEWTERGDWGDANIISGIGKLVYSQSERLVYIALVWNFIDHLDLLSSFLILFVIAYAAMWNPQPAPETWRFIFWYAVSTFYIRILIRSKIFCMQLDSALGANDRNKWHISIQPFCPSQTLYDPSVDDRYSTLSATLLTVPRARSMVRDEVLTDIFLIATLIIHISHMQSLGQFTRRDTAKVKPRKDYEEVHSASLERGKELMTVGSMSPEIIRIESLQDRKLSVDTKSKSKKRMSSKRRSLRRYLKHFSVFARMWHFIVKQLKDLTSEITLSNSRKYPARNVGKPGIDLYPLEIFLQLIITLWFVIDYSNLVFESSTALSSTESFGTGLTISILSSVGWMTLMRLVYLTQNIRLKFFFHVLQVVAYVICVFIVVPLADPRVYVSPRHNSHLKGFTALVLLHFCVNAIQIREGFREGYQFKVLLMRLGYSPVGRAIYNIVNVLPFFFEVRTLLDWVVCDTSLDYVMWFRYETMYYLLHKTSMVLAHRKNKREIYSGARPFPKLLKLLIGGGIILIIMTLLTGPIFIFSTFNPALTRNGIETATLTVQLDVVSDGRNDRNLIYTGFATGYEMSSESEQVIRDELLGSTYYQNVDADCVQFPKYSEASWVLPAASRADLAMKLTTTAADSDCQATVTFSTAFTRNGPPSAATVSHEFIAELSDSQCVDLATIINANTGSISLDGIIPRGIHLPPTSEIQIIDTDATQHIGVTMTLSGTGGSQWAISPATRSFSDEAPDFCSVGVNEQISDTGLLFGALSDRYLVGLVSSLGLSNYSLRALYTFIFFTIGFAVRSIFSFKLSDVFVNEIVNTDELINVCRGIRLIRSLDYPGRRRDELTMYHALHRMMRESALRRVVSRNADDL